MWIRGDREVFERVEEEAAAMAGGKEKKVKNFGQKNYQNCDCE